MFAKWICWLCFNYVHRKTREGSGYLCQSFWWEGLCVFCGLGRDQPQDPGSKTHLIDAILNDCETQRSGPIIGKLSKSNDQRGPNWLELNFDLDVLHMDYDEDNVFFIFFKGLKTYCHQFLLCTVHSMCSTHVFIDYVRSLYLRWISTRSECEWNTVRIRCSELNPRPSGLKHPSVQIFYFFLIVKSLLLPEELY